MVGLDPVTNPYHARDLGQGLPCCTFTNLYHRDGGLGIELSIVAGNQHQATGWHRVIRVDNGAAQWRTLDVGQNGGGRCREEKSFLNQAGRLVNLYPWW